MVAFVTADPRTAGLAAVVGATVLYVQVAGPSGPEATLVQKYGPTDTEWATVPVTGGGEPVTADPRSSGLARPLGARALYVVAKVGTLLYKYGASDTEWCIWDRSDPSTAVASNNYFPGGWT